MSPKKDAVVTQEAARPAALSAETLESVLVAGDLSKLSTEARLSYYMKVCDSVGLNPLTKPFEYLNLNGKLRLYALKAATDQLASLHGIICEIADQRTDDGMRVVTVRARAANGRQTDEIGAVPLTGKKGDDLANAMMKAVTKAKRRAVLSLCGLGILDETEVETISGARVMDSAPLGKPALPKSEAPPADPEADAEIARLNSRLVDLKQAYADIDKATLFGSRWVACGGPAAWPLTAKTVESMKLVLAALDTHAKSDLSGRSAEDTTA